MSTLPVVWEWDVGDRFCVLEGLQHVRDEYQLSKGISRAQDFPKDACFHMSARHRKYVALADNLSNLGRSLVVSRKLKEFVEARKPRDVEFLRVSLFDHKQKLASDEYFIINPIRVVDCIDKDKSRYKWNNIDPEKMSSCSKMVLKPEALDPELLMFRPRHVEYYVLVHPELAKALEDEGFTGLRFTPIDEFQT
ncbi:imm11 family protein [Pyxidicoccus caerfyrddinensis]|uniref:imm11 family protein n=1 Tax=Pyxidicoccus caerfyrddinensis TaxID=2709663 RepID=UPI0013DB96C0|nr:DUF1629 domain-containing protein [Pyxidicoccus caerfyrddinensis]